jgi:hypothetical protein
MNFTIFNCKKLYSETKTFMYTDMSVVCWEGEHAYYAYRLGLPTTIIWLIGTPVVTLIYMFKNRRSVKSSHQKEMFGFLTSGLQDKYYFWELILYAEKVFIIMANIFLTSFDPLFRVISFNFLTPITIGNLWICNSVPEH